MKIFSSEHLCHQSLATSNTCLVRKRAKIKLTKPNQHSYHASEVLFKQEAFFKIIGIASSIKEETHDT